MAAMARRYDGRSSPAPSKLRITTSKATKRASSASVLSALGVRDPEKALDPPSPTSVQTGRSSLSDSVSPQSDSKRPSKLHNFFGHRPPSELITTHLTEYFPNTEKKVLQRTARHSMLRTNALSSAGKRDSGISWNTTLPSRFSSSTQGSATRASMSSTRNSFSSHIAAPPLPGQSFEASASSPEDLPRVSLSTDDGRSIELDSELNHSSLGVRPIPKSDYSPQLLPPIPFPTESLSESMESITGGNRMSRRMSRTMSGASKRNSVMEIRPTRDRTDTASLMTVDEITAEVESRRESKTVEDDDLDDFMGDEEEEEAFTEIESEETTLKDEEEVIVDEGTLEMEADGSDSDEEDEPGMSYRFDLGVLPTFFPVGHS